MTTIIDKTFRLVKKRCGTSFKKDGIPDELWTDLIYHSNIGTRFIINDKLYSIIFLKNKITIVDVDDYAANRKQTVLKEEEYDDIPKDALVQEPTQDESRNVRRFKSFWF